MPSELTRRAFKTALIATHTLGTHRLLGEERAGLGVIFMLHRIRPEFGPRPAFAPNQHLSISPEFLARVIARVRSLGMDIVSLDEATERINSDAPGRRFAVFTLDDGYRDNLEFGYPIFRNSDAPFTIFLTSSWPDWHGIIWWRVLEEIVGASEQVIIERNGLPAALPTRTAVEKRKAFEQIMRIHAGIDETQKLDMVRRLAERNGIEFDAICRRDIMGWNEIGNLARDELATFGAHSVTHPALARLPEAQMHRELYESRQTIENKLGRPCRHLAYPYGGVGWSVGPREFAAAADLGFTSAVLSGGGPVTTQHRTSPTALPRIHLDGALQDLRCLDVLMSGLPYLLKILH